MLIIIPKKIEICDFIESRTDSTCILPRSAFEIVSKSQLQKLYEIHMAFERSRKILIESVQEVLGCIFLNSKRQLIAMKTLNRGGYSKVQVPIEKLNKTIHELSDSNAYGKVKYMVFFHNHPSGVALPSNEDLICSKSMGDYFSEHAGVQLVESFVGGQIADLRFTDKVLSQIVETNMSPLTSEVFFELEKIWGKTHPEWFFRSNNRGFYFFSKDGICPGIGLS